MEVKLGIQPGSRGPGTICPNRIIYDVFIDLSGAHLDRSALNDYLNILARDAGLAEVAGQVTLALSSEPPGPIIPSGLLVEAVSAQPGTVSLARAVNRAAVSHRHLVVMLGPVAAGNDVLSLLIDSFDRDSLFGTTQPRFAESTTDLIWPLPGSDDRDRAGPKTSRAALHFLSFGTITAEFLAVCLVVRWNVLAAIDTIDHGYASVPGALLHLLCQARRRGMRNFVVNRAVVSSDLAYAAVYPTVPSSDLDRLRAAYPDNSLAEAEISYLAQRRLEPLLSAAGSGSRSRRCMLLDCRGMIPSHNGTSQCVLGLMSGFAMLDSGWQTDILVLPAAAEFHRLAQRYPEMRQLHDQPAGEYTAAVRLDQPWAISTVAELHRHALLIVFNMLDTISWDVLYPTGNPTTLAKVWRFVARYADGLLFISHFGRERFNARFPIGRDVSDQVTHLSLAQDDYIDPIARMEPLSDQILIFGNEYDHKDLGPTVRLLADAFPFNEIVSFGGGNFAPAPNVVAISSGQIEQAKLHKLIASARVIVYPSFYEGFGLPVVEGLAYGRPVVVRRSPLWAEIAAWSRLPGELIEFDDAASLVEGIGRVLGGLPGRALPSGRALPQGTTPANWRDCASRVIALLDRRIAQVDGSRWLEREEALNVAGF